MDVYTVGYRKFEYSRFKHHGRGYVSRAEILDDPDCLFSGNPFKLITLPALKW
jgi:hypothetical protein